MTLRMFTKWLCFCLVGLYLPMACADKTEKPVMIVIDASPAGHELSAQRKLSIAHQVLGYANKKYCGKLHVGLMVYGQNMHGRCNNIEVLQPVSKINPRVITNTVNQHQPDGVSPLGAALLKTASQLQTTSKPAALIIVADGGRYCKVNFCRLADQLIASSSNVHAYPIAVDADHYLTRSLRCLAYKTKGRLYVAHDAWQLRRAISHAIRQYSHDKLNSTV